MDRRKLRKLKRELDQLADPPRPVKASVLESIAKKLGRRQRKGQRTSEPAWIREEEPLLCPPLSIPHHSKDLKTWTARSIIDALLSDVDVWEIHLQSKEDEGEDEDENDEEDQKDDD